MGAVSPDLLYARSVEMAAFRTLAGDLERIMVEAALMVPRSAGPPPELAHLYPDPMASVDADMLRAAAAELLADPPALDLTHVTPIEVSLQDALHEVETRLAVVPNVRFMDLIPDREDRVQVVVTLLAVLELYREGKVDLTQDDAFGDIHLLWRRQAAR